MKLDKMLETNIINYINYEQIFFIQIDINYPTNNIILIIMALYNLI